jgi:hypothetical protein
MGSVDNAPDQVMRLRGVLGAHPHVTYLSGRESGDGKHAAIWTQPSVDPAQDGAVVRVAHERLGDLVDELVAMLGPGRPQ